MSIYDELTRAIEEHDAQFQPKPIRQRGQLGYTVDSVYSIIEPSDRAQYRVRLDNKSFVTAYHNGKCAPQPDLSVWVVQDELGRYHIESVDVTNVSSTNPNNPSQAFTAPHSHGRGSGLEFPIDPRLLSAFQIRPIGGLQVYVNGGAYKYEGKWKWFGGDTLDLTASVPSSASLQRWAVLTLDHATSTITVKNGATQSIVSPLTIEQIEAVTVTGIPIGAVRLRYGQTSVTETDMEALHILVDSFPKHNYSGTSQPTVSDDETLGYGVSSKWFDQVNQIPYVCIDATAGAAVWVSGGGGGGSDPVSSTKETITIKKVIYDTTLSANGTFTIPLTADDDLIEIDAYVRSTATGFSDTVYFEVNGDAVASNYRHSGYLASTTLSVQVADTPIIGFCVTSDGESNAYSQINIKSGFLRQLNYMRSFNAISNVRRDLTHSNINSVIAHSWRSTNAVTSLLLRPDDGSDSFSTGSRVIVYRIKELDVVTEVTGTSSPMFPIELDYAETIPTNKQIVLSHINIITGGSLEVNGVAVYTGGE